MQEIRIEKVSINMGLGNDQDKIEKAMLLLERITSSKAVKTFAKRRIPEWNIRPGVAIGCKVTLRKEKAVSVLRRLLKAVENKLKSKGFDRFGNLAFGIDEYIKIPGVEYDPNIGIIGLEVAVSFEKKGYRVKRRKFLRSKVGKGQLISKEEAMKYLEKEFGVEYDSK